MTTAPNDALAAQLTVPPSPDAGWQEPTLRLPLRWGSYALRYRLGVALLVGAALAANAEGSAALPLLVVLALAGMVVMPARQGRRWLALVLLIAAPFAGWLGLGLGGALVVLAWLIVRERSGLSYAVAVPSAVLVTFVVARLFDGAAGTAVSLLTWVGIAWLVRALEPGFGARGELARTTAQVQRSQLGAASEAEAIAAQVRTMAALQAAWESEHPGQPMPAIAVAPTTGTAATGSNTLAVLSLVFGLLGGGIVAVILGHLARGQIRRTGEGGDGMAIAGLVLGYLGLTVLVVYLVAVAGLLASLS